MTQATMSIDPRLIKMVGRKLYSSHPIPIIVRELLQNSVDACKRKGVEPRITIIVREIQKRDNDWLISCEDNGIGMTADQIVNDFLCLGGKKAEMNGQTGGFGIAKAAIMGCDNWSVKSLDNFVDRDTLLEGKNIQKRKWRDGTKVTVRLKEQAWGSHLRLALQMIYYSDVSVTLTVIRSSWPEVKIIKVVAGLPQNGKPRKILDEHDWITVWGSTDLGLDDRLTDVKDVGWNVVRLNGLMQFLHGYKSGQRKTTLMFDVKTNKSPEDADYPFSMSRESVTSTYENLIDSIVKAHDANVMQSISTVARETPAEERVDVIPGKKLSGTRKTSYPMRPADPGSMGNQAASRLVANEQKIASLRNGHGRVKMAIVRYKRDPEKREWHSKVLLAWQDIMQLTAQDNEEFGIGISSDPYEEAGRLTLDGEVYYIINPDLAVPDWLHEGSKESIVMALWGLACHEATHRYVDDHNEWFTTTREGIGRDSAEVILRCVKKIAKRLL